MTAPPLAGYARPEKPKPAWPSLRAFCIPLMPTAPARPCKHQGCSALVRDGSGYCAAHEADRKAGTFADTRRGTRHERGYGTKWDKLRKVILRRDKGLCQVCLAGGKYRPAKQVDHIRAKSQGGTDAEDNLQSICVECHQAKTANEAAAGRGG